MESIIIYPKNKKQLKAIEAFFEAMEIPFKKPKKKPNPNNPSPSGDPWFDDPRNLAMVEKGFADVKAGRVHVLTDELKKELFGDL